MWNRFTNLGDLAVMLPLAATIAIWLAAQKQFASSLRWLLAFGSAGLLVAISKIAFIGWGIGSRDFDFTGISGHTMLATATLPVLLFLPAKPRLATTPQQPWHWPSAGWPALPWLLDWKSTPTRCPKWFWALPAACWPAAGLPAKLQNATATKRHSAC
jgi:hypothetical protein